MYFARSCNMFPSGEAFMSLWDEKRKMRLIKSWWCGWWEDEAAKQTMRATIKSECRGRRRFATFCDSYTWIPCKKQNRTCSILILHLLYQVGFGFEARKWVDNALTSASILQVMAARDHEVQWRHKEFLFAPCCQVTPKLSIHEQSHLKE